MATRNTKNRHPTRQIDPNAESAYGAPILFATPPAIKAPSGWTPMHIVGDTAMRRLRSSSGTRPCTIVLVAASCEVAEKPTISSIAADSQNTCDCENKISPTAQAVEVAAIHSTRPL